MTTKPRLAILVKVTEDYGQTNFHAEIVWHNTESDASAYQFRSLMFSDRFGDNSTGVEFEGLDISAYIGHSADLRGRDDDPSEVWGLSTGFHLHTIDSADHATAIARVFGKLERGRRKLDESDGYVSAGDYATYVIRTARVLGIKEIYVRNHRKSFDMTGNRYSLKTGAQLQSWVTYAAQDVAEGRAAEYVR